MKTRLKQAEVQKIKTDPEKRQTFWDTDVKGLALIVNRSGTKSFTLHYRTHDGTRRKPTIAHFPETTVSAARKIARGILADVDKGGDWSAEKQAKRQTLTLQEFFTEYYVPKYAALKKPKSVEKEAYTWAANIAPALGTKKITSIRARDINDLHGKMKDTPYSANRCVALLSNIFTKAIQWEFRDGPNPCQGVERYKERPRVRYLSPEEFRRLYDAIGTARKYKIYSDSVLGVLEVMLWTGCRKGEALGLRWEYIDFNRERAILPDSKTGPKEIILNPAAMQTIDRMDRSGAYVFPSDRNPGEPLKEIRPCWEGIKRLAVSRMDCPFCDDDHLSGEIERDAIDGVSFTGWRYRCEACGFDGDIADVRRKRTGTDTKAQDLNPKDHEALVGELRQAGAPVPTMSDLRMHDLRHGYASLAAGLQLGLPVIGGLLGHSEQRTTQRYAHAADDAKQAAALAVYERMREMMQPEGDGATVQDVELHRGGNQDAETADGGAS